MGPLTANILNSHGEKPTAWRQSDAASINEKSGIEPPKYRFVDSDNYYEVIDGNHRTYFLRTNVPTVTHVLAIVDRFFNFENIKDDRKFWEDHYEVRSWKQLHQQLLSLQKKFSPTKGTT